MADLTCETHCETFVEKYEFVTLNKPRTIMCVTNRLFIGHMRLREASLYAAISLFLGSGIIFAPRCAAASCSPHQLNNSTRCVNRSPRS